MTGTFRWWPVDGARHAVPGELLPGDEGTTLCGQPVTISVDGATKTQWLWPTCTPCYEAAKSRQPTMMRTWLA